MFFQCVLIYEFLLFVIYKLFILLKFLSLGFTDSIFTMQHVLEFLCKLLVNIRLVEVQAICFELQLSF